MQDVLLQWLVHETVLVHATQSCSTTDTRTNAVTDFGDVHVLVELVRVSDTGRQKRLGSGDEDVERDRVHLLDDVVWDTVELGVPASRDLAGDKAVEAECLRNVKGRVLLQAHLVLSRLKLEDLDVVTVLTLELMGRLLRSLERVKVLLDLNLLKHLLLVGVVAVE